MASALVYVVASLVVALGGGLFVFDVLSPDDPVPPAALATASPAASAAATATSEPSLPTPVMTAEPASWPSPVVEPDPSKRLSLTTPSMGFEADALRIRLGADMFTLDPSAEPQVASHVQQNLRGFDLDWVDDGSEVSLSITLLSDGADYWVDRLDVWVDPNQDGFDNGSGSRRGGVWGPRLFVTPLGQPMEADVRLTRGQGADKAALVIDGMRITAFPPASGPWPRTACQPPVVSEATRKALALDGLATLGERLEEMPDRFEKQMLERFMARYEVAPPRAESDSGLTPGEVLLDGWDEPEHPFAGTGIWTMSPSEVESILREAGVCFEFGYTHPTGAPADDHPLATEAWCWAPPDGAVTGLTYWRDRVIVSVWGGTVRPAGDVPPQGWGCPTL